MFDWEKWQCGGCGRKGTLCQRIIGGERLSPIFGIDEKSVQIGRNFIYKSQDWTHLGGTFDGYVCGMCGMRVAKSQAELFEQLGE